MQKSQNQKNQSSPEVGTPEFWAQTTFETGTLTPEEVEARDQELKDRKLAKDEAIAAFQKSLIGLSKRKIRRNFTHPANFHTNQVSSLLRRLNLEKIADKNTKNG